MGNNVHTFKTLAEIYGVLHELCVELDLPYDVILADSDMLLVDDNCLTLDDFNCSDNNISHDNPYFNGLIQAGFICVTLDGAIFKNIYLTRLNKLDIITHHRVRSNFIIKKHLKDNIYDVML